MDFGFNTDQQALRASAREVLTKHAGPAAYRRVMESKDGYDEALWRTVADLGWTATAIAEGDGGLGLGLVELAILLEETGRALLPAPFLSTVGLAAPMVAASGESSVRSDFLRRVAAGEVRATLALTEQEGRWDAAGIRAKAARTDGGWHLSGRKAFVCDAHVADEIVVVARTGRARDPKDGLSIFLVPRNALRWKPRPQASLDNTRRLADVRLTGVEVPSERLIGPEGGGWPIIAQGIDRAAVAIAAEAVGVCQRVLEMSIAHASEREQFGRKIGSFQAVSHRIANQMVLTESARSTLYYAAWALDEGTPDASLAAATAKAAAGAAAHDVSNAGIQVHGGIGFTWEHDMHLYYRRAKWGELYLGDTPTWRERIAALAAS